MFLCGFGGFKPDTSEYCTLLSSFGKTKCNKTLQDYFTHSKDVQGTVLCTQTIEYHWQVTYPANFSKRAYCGVSLWKRWTTSIA